MRVLLVEDDPRIAHFVAKGLREQAYAVDVVADADSALEHAFLHGYDVIVLDVVLVQGDGIQICRALRERGSGVPVLMLTARDAVQDRIRGLDAGADDYLTKPFDFGELLARVRALLRRGTEMLPSLVTVGDLRIDRKARRVWRGEREIPLTAKEFSLLEYLAINADRVLGRAEISEHVWDENYDPASNLIEVYVKRLRRKLEIDGEPLIHTRRGAGYVLDAGTGSSTATSGG